VKPIYFDSRVYEQDIVCNFKQIRRTEGMYRIASCGECSDCLDPEKEQFLIQVPKIDFSKFSGNHIFEQSVISEYQNLNQLKPDIQVIFNNNETCPQFAGGYNTTDEYGNLVIVDNCECERRKVISDPTIGYGEFNIRSGLFLDERLQTPLPVDQGRFHQKYGLL